MAVRWKRVLIVCALFGLFARAATCQDKAPLALAATIRLPADIQGPFDHLAVDVKGKRLFVTPEDYKSILVIDLNTNKVLKKIDGIERPHAILFRADLKRLYVTDGGAGDLKIYDSDSYGLLKSIKLLPDADSIGFDMLTGYLYIDNGGGDAKQSYSMVSVVDTRANEKLADIKVEGETLEALGVEQAGRQLFVNNRSKNQVEVIDRSKRALTASWPVTKAKDNVAMALDEVGQRLYVGCRSGAVVVFDVVSGKELTSVPIAKGVDDVAYDAKQHRLYAATDGEVDVYQQAGAGEYKSLGKVPTGPRAKTALLVPSMQRYFVAAPAHNAESAAILVFAVQ